MVKTGWLIATTALLACAWPASAQDVAAPVEPADVVETPVTGDQVDFASAQLEYDSNSDIVTASGDVRMTREGNRVRADRIVWNRRTGEVRAEGNVAIVNPGGDTAYGDSVELTDTLKDGVVDNLLLVLTDGGRLAARRGTRENSVSTLEQAAYSPCPVTDEAGCPKNPSWQISAVRIVHDPIKKRISFKGARLVMFGIPLIVLPSFSTPIGQEGGSGFLVPDVQYTQNNGLEFSLPYYLRIGPNRDLTITPRIYTDVLPAVDATYRALTSNGAYRIGAFATYSARIPTNIVGGTGRDEFRGYLDASGRFQLDPEWSIRGSIRRATDRTLLRRYDLSYEDRLRSTIAVERIRPNDYLALTGWAVQTLRALDVQGQNPVALPELDYRRRLDDPLLGGRVELQLNALALGRTSGQDTQRAFASARWDLRRITSLGQEVIVTAYARGDVYHSDENLATSVLRYRGLDGVQGRGIAALAGEMRWPLIGAAFGGTQRVTPRVQLVASPTTSNLRIPNEDSRSVDLEDTNLFALNRFPGYDRWEDGARVTYGVDYAFDRPGLSIEANVGQSYRLANRPQLFPDGTGLTDRLSDIVGRTRVKYRNLLSLTHRYRLDKNGLALRRNEVDATVGNERTYALIGYLKLNRNIGAELEDLRDREEIRLGGRIEFRRFFSVFGSTTIDLTDRAEDPTSLADGYQPVRHRLGVAYTDDCLDIGLTWRRDYDTAGDARRGNSFLLRVAFRGLGR